MSNLDSQRNRSIVGRSARSVALWLSPEPDLAFTVGLSNPTEMIRSQPKLRGCRDRAGIRRVAGPKHHLRHGRNPTSRTGAIRLLARGRYEAPLSMGSCHRRRLESNLRPFEILVNGIERAHRESQHHEPTSDELDELAVDRFVVSLSSGNPIGAETSAGTGFWPVFTSHVKDTSRASGFRFDRQTGLREMTSAEADATMKSLRWHDAAFKLMRRLRAPSHPTVCHAIRSTAVLVSPPMDRRVQDGSGAIRYYSEVVSGPLHAGGPTSTIAIGRVNGPTVYDLMTQARAMATDQDVVRKAKFDLVLDLTSLTATDQALFARFSDLDLPSEEEIHRSYLSKTMRSFEVIASAASLETDDRSARLIGQSLAKLVKSIAIRVHPVAKANVGLRSDPAPRNWILDSGDTDVRLADLAGNEPRSSAQPCFRRFPDHVRRIDVPTTIGYGLYFEDFAHLTEFHWAGFDTDQKMRIRFVGDLIREMLLVVFCRPNDQAAIDRAEELAIDINLVFNGERTSWTPRIRERFECWTQLNARNYEVGGFLRKLRQVELNLAYRDNVIEKLRHPGPTSRADTDLKNLIELETVGYLRSCAVEIHKLGNCCELSIGEINAFARALNGATESLSDQFRTSGGG